MPASSRFSIAKADIVTAFDNLSARVLREEDVSAVFNEHRDFWRLPKSMTLAEFIAQMLRKTPLRRLTYPFRRPVSGYIWGEVPFLETLQGLVRRSHFSHYTAVRVHGLTEQVPKTVYLTQERSGSPPGPPNPLIAQEAIDRAFRQAPRMSADEIVVEDTRIVLLSGSHGDLDVGWQDVNLGSGQDQRLRVTSLERTLIDIAVRPFYAGGVTEVAKAFERARDIEVSINTVAALLKKLGFIYPYHQAIGYYLERARYRPSQIDLLRRFPQDRDFYLTHAMSATDYVKAWRLFVPKGF